MEHLSCLHFDSISKFAEYLVQCGSVHRHAQQLTLWKLNITRVQQDQSRDPNVNVGHQDANSKSHTAKRESKVVHNKAQDDYIKNSTITKCSQETDSEHTKQETDREHTKHSQETKSEQKVTLICDICSKTLDNLYNLNFHKEKCKEKNLHKVKCKEKQTFICKICSKKIG